MFYPATIMPTGAYASWYRVNDSTNISRPPITGIYGGTHDNHLFVRLYAMVSFTALAL